MISLFLILQLAYGHANPRLTLSLFADTADTTDIAQISAQKFIQTASQQTVSIELKPGIQRGISVEQGRSDLILMPLHRLARQIPELAVLELPFFYSDIHQLHKQLDGKLGKYLKQQAYQRGWQILAWWDEGMQVFSGNRRYNERINLTGMEFILLRDDPMAELQFKSFNAWSRRVSAESSQQLLKECAVGSRSASLQRIWAERLDRVHLSVSLSRHRYEGWVLAAPLSGWQKLPEIQRQQLQQAAIQMQNWQRQQASHREQVALDKLKQNNMQIYELTPEKRQQFIQRLPAWPDLLPVSLSPETKQILLTTAAGT